MYWSFLQISSIGTIEGYLQTEIWATKEEGKQWELEPDTWDAGQGVFVVVICWEKEDGELGQLCGQFTYCLPRRTFCSLSKSSTVPFPLLGRGYD